jgi:hypothetical protein
MQSLVLKAEAFFILSAKLIELFLFKASIILGLFIPKKEAN